MNPTNFEAEPSFFSETGNMPNASMPPTTQTNNSNGKSSLLTSDDNDHYQLSRHFLIKPSYFIKMNFHSSQSSLPIQPVAPSQKQVTVSTTRNCTSYTKKIPVIYPKSYSPAQDTNLSKNEEEDSHKDSICCPKATHPTPASDSSTNKPTTHFKPILPKIQREEDPPEENIVEPFFVEIGKSFNDCYKTKAFNTLMLDLGPEIRRALLQPDITEIMVNSDSQIYVESSISGMQPIGTLNSTSALSVVRILASIEEKELDHKYPILSGEIPKLNVRFEGVLPPLVKSPIFSIRRHHFQNLSLEQLQEKDMLTFSQYQTLVDALNDHLSIVICGATGSGKTTLLNGLICKIAGLFPKERIITIEDTPELKIISANKLNLYTSHTVDISCLVRSSMRLRPDRLIVGEVRGAEALDLIDAFSTGHRGGITSIHAGSVEQALNRLILLVSRHPQAPRLIEPTIGGAIDLIVVVQRLPYRHVCQIARVSGYSNEGFIYKFID